MMEMMAAMHDRPGVWPSFFTSVGLSVLLGIGGSAAQPELSPSLGLEIPFLSGTEFWAHPLPIDLGGDGATDFIIFGAGLLRGAYPLEDPWGRQTLHVITREREGEWRHLQSFTFDRNVANTAIGDLNGDGLEDLIVLTSGSGGITIHLLQQTTSGHLTRSSDYVMPRRVYLNRVCIADVGNPRVLLNVDWLDEITGEEVHGGVLLGWNQETGFDVLWQEALPIESSSWSSPDVIGLISTPTELVAVVSNHGPDIGRHLVEISVKSDGWGEYHRLPVPIRYEDDFGLIRHRGRNELWCWARESPDTLKVLRAEMDEDTLTLGRIPINGYRGPEKIGAGDFYGRSKGDFVYLCRRVNTQGRNDQMALLAVDPEKECAEVASYWSGPFPNLRGLVVDQEGMIEILWDCSTAYFLKPAMERAFRLPDYTLSIDGIPLQYDFDTDGLLDLVAYATPQSQPRALYLLMGTGHPPWFGEPVMIGAADVVLDMGVGDVDGDDQVDLVFRCVDESSHTAYCVPYYWNGWRFIRDDGARFYEPPHSASPYYFGRMNLNDYDGDGRDELLDRSRECFIGWETDRRPRQEHVYLVPPLYDDVAVVADLDGDGRSEMVSSRSSVINISWVDPTDGIRQRVGGWIASSAIRTIDALNLDADPASELIIGYDYGSTILDFDHVAEDSYSATPGPTSFVDGDSWLSSDINLDGYPELIRTLYGLIEVSSGVLEKRTVRHLLTEEGASGLPVRDDPGCVWLDVDHDGDLDLMVVCSNGLCVHVNGQVAPSSVVRDEPWIRVVSENPGREGVRVAIRFEQSTMVSMGLFDVSGRRVWSSTTQAIGERWFNIMLDPESVGRSLAAGVYFLRVEGGQHAATRRIILAR